jgi:hypothetical protein
MTRTGFDVLDEEARLTKSLQVHSYASQPLPRHHTFPDVTDAISSSTTAPWSIFDKNVEMTNGLGAGTKQELSSEMTAENPQSTGRLPSDEQRARQRFISKFNSGSGLLRKGKLKHKRFTVHNQHRVTIFSSWLNILLLAVPAGFVVNYLGLNLIAVFFVNFAAILPLNTLFSYAIDELTLPTGLLGGILVCMSFG